MGVDPLTLGIIAGVGSSILGGASANSQARQQNRALQASADSSKRAATVQQGQLEEQAAQTILESRREASRIAARARVLTANAGLSFGDTARDVQQSIALAQEEDRLAVTRNLENESLRLRSGLEANISELTASSVNTGLRTISGFVGGAGSGLSLASGIRGLSK